MEDELIVATYNVCDSRRTNEGSGLEAYGWEKRAPHLVKTIADINADILCVQEIKLAKTKEFTEANNQYHWFTRPQNARGGNFTNIGIAVTKKIAIDNIEWVEYDFKEHHVDGEMVVGCLIDKILVVSVHKPMGVAGRKSTVKNFPKFLAKYNYDRLMICGDFNCFPCEWGYQQVPLMNAMCSTYTLSQFALLESTGKFAKHSFEPYPYDVVPKEALKLIGALDVMLGKGVYLVGKVTVHDSYIPSTNIHPSDHLCMSCKITWNLEKADF